MNSFNLHKFWYCVDWTRVFIPLQEFALHNELFTKSFHLFKLLFFCQLNAVQFVHLISTLVELVLQHLYLLIIVMIFTARRLLATAWRLVDFLFNAKGKEEDEAKT